MASSISLALEKNSAEVAVGSLYPILPQQTGRYNVKKRVKRSHALVGAGMFTATTSPAPLYLPQHWSTHTHPEGQVYFVRSGSIRAVTDSYLYNSELSDKIVAWTHYIEKEVQSKSFHVPDTAELYVQIEDEDCNYYFADHATRTLFWLDGYNTTDLGLLPVVSPSHLKLQLEEQYWTHVEYHCMHAIPFPSNIVEEVISQLIHACGDQMTSQSSTFPYSYKECKRFIEILLPARDRTVHDGHVVTLVARIFNVISNNRYWTHYGQEQARLSRDSSIIEEEDSHVNWPSILASAVSMKSSDFFVDRLNTIFTDNYVYVADWQRFMTQALVKWKNAFLQSLALLMLHVFSFFFPVSQTLASASAGFLGLSMFLSAILIHQHQDLQTSTAGDAYTYLSRNQSKKYKFQTLGLFMSLPQALSLWGLILTMSQAMIFLTPFHVYILFFASIFTSIVYACRTFFTFPRGRAAPEKDTVDSIV